MTDDFATIRTAYRYVVAYERRILDVITQVDDAVKVAGFERNMPHRWQPLYRSFPARDWAPDHWAWDHVPLMTARFRWNKGVPNEAGSRCVLLDHVADTAFEDLRRRTTSEPEPLRGLAPAEASRSVLRWLVVDITEPIPAALWNRSWEELLPRHIGRPLGDFLPGEPTSGPLRASVAGVNTEAFCVDLAALADPATVEAEFLVPLRTAIGSGP